MARRVDPADHLVWMDLEMTGLDVERESIVEVATPNEGWDQPVHRLNKQVVIDDFTAGGFELVEESDMLANPDDDYSVDGFEQGRWTTDRYVLKFRKPGS